MSTPSSNQYFEAIHASSTPPSDPNLFTAAEIVAGSFDSAAVSAATSKAVSTVNAAAPDSTSISQANSAAVSAASRGSIADSKALSNSAPTSVADSKAVSVSANASVADSKAVSVGNSVPILTVVANSQMVSTADSKAVSVGAATAFPVGTRTVTTTKDYLANNANFNILDYAPLGVVISTDVNDARSALALADAAALAAGGSVLIPNGTFRVLSNVTVSSPVVWAEGNGDLKPASGVTITLNGEVVANRAKIFDTSLGGTLAGFGANTIIMPEWWGAHSVLGGAVNDDANATTNATALQASANVLNDDHIWSLHHQYVINATLTFPNKSWTILGTSPTGCGFRASTITTSITLLDFTGCNGPGKIIQDITLTNPANGVTGGTGVDTLNANGFWFRNVWFGGLTIGLRVRGSFISATDCAFEFNTTALSIEGPALPEESQFRGITFYQNATDIAVGALDMTGTIIDGTVHTNTSLDCVITTGATSHLRIQNVLIGTGVTGTGVHFNNGALKCSVRGLKVKSALTGLSLQNCTDCTVDGFEDDGSTVALYIGNGVTTRNRVRSVRIKGATTGIKLEFPGVDNSIEGFDVRTCTTGVLFAAGGFSDGTVALKHGLVIGNTTNFSLLSAINLFEAFDVRSDNYGDFKSNMDLVANKITALYYNDLGNRRIVVGSKIPTAATFAVGDRVWNSVPTVGQPKSWVCTVAGTPGTWVSEGNL